MAQLVDISGGRGPQREHQRSSGHPVGVDLKWDQPGVPRVMQGEGWHEQRWSASVGGPLPLQLEARDGLAYSYGAVLAATQRLQNAAGRMEAAGAWAAAVESVWWLAALDEHLSGVFRPVGAGTPPRLGDPWGRERWDRYREIRRADSEGQVMDGLMWVRHRHTRELAMSGAGWAVPFFGKGTFFMRLSAGYSWRQRTHLRHAEDDDQQPHLAPLYDEHVAGRQLEAPITSVVQWLGRLFLAMGMQLQTVDAPARDPRTLGGGVEMDASGA